MDTILIIDDTPTNLGVLVDSLENEGFRTVIASDGKLGLLRAKHVLPSLILLDVMMPGIDGFETCRRLKTDDATRDIPVLFMTALSETENKLKGFHAGGVDYITKPIQTEELLARVKTHLTIRKLQQELQQEHERVQRLAEATFEGLVFHDNKRILDANQAIASISGYQRSELLSTSLLDLFTPLFRQFVSEQIASGETQPYEADMLSKNGTSLPVELQMKTFPWEEREIQVLACRDISWRKQMEKEQAQLRKENLTLRSTMHDRYKFGEIIGKSQPMQNVYHAIIKAAASEANVLVYGESGTGKELVAKTIHQLSDRKDGAFVAVNCGAVPENLFEREFFGHRKGAFTGATSDQPGYFDRAHNGTLFLDEVGEMQPTLQVKLLRALQENEYTPLGSTKSKKVDVRIIAATNKDLKELLRNGEMREDFYYRIRVTVINLPPLRKRKEDIPLLVEFFLSHYGKDEEPISIPAKIMETLSVYHWPGNIRELQNEIQRYLAEQRLEFLEDVHPSHDIQANRANAIMLQDDLSFKDAVEAFEKRLIESALEHNAGHLGNTSKMLDIPQKTLYRKIRKYELLGAGK